MTIMTNICAGFTKRVYKRDSSVLYYDCTNFYFECEKEDDVVVDEVTGEIMAGLRKYGVSKEHRPNPIVEMGLFMDKNGIPISMCIHPGNTSEQLTAVPLEKEILKMIDGAKFIYCADAGLGSYNIRKFNSMGGRAFIVTQSIKKLSDVLKKAVFNDYEYKLLSNDRPVSVETLKTMDKTEPNVIKSVTAGPAGFRSGERSFQIEKDTDRMRNCGPDTVRLRLCSRRRSKRD